VHSSHVRSQLFAPHHHAFDFVIDAMCICAADREKNDIWPPRRASYLMILCIGHLVEDLGAFAGNLPILVCLPCMGAVIQARKSRSLLLVLTVCTPAVQSDAWQAPSGRRGAVGDAEGGPIIPVRHARVKWQGIPGGDLPCGQAPAALQRA